MKGQGLGEGPKTNEAVTGPLLVQRLALKVNMAPGCQWSVVLRHCLSSQFGRQGPLSTLHTQTSIHTFLGHLGPQGMRILAFSFRKVAVSISRLYRHCDSHIFFPPSFSISSHSVMGDPITTPSPSIHFTLQAFICIDLRDGKRGRGN